MRTLLKILLVLAVAGGLLYHTTWYRGYFAVGGEIIVPIVIALLMIGGHYDKRKKQSRSNC